MRHLDWSKARPYLVEHQPILADIIDELDPPPSLKLHHCRLAFGELLTHKGQFQLSTHPYHLIPAGLVLNKQFEIFMSTPNRVIPYFLLNKGDLFGFSYFFNKTIKTDYKLEMPQLLSISAGARSLFFLNKLGDRVNLKRLISSFNQDFPLVRNFNEHWDLLRILGRQLEANWEAEVLLFDQAWLQFDQDPVWSSFYLYLLKSVFKNQVFQRDFLAWQAIFSDIEEEKNLRYSPHLLNTAKHLFALASKLALGFSPQINDEMAPIHYFKQVILERYGLQQQPVIMGPAYFKECSPIYYSLAYPTLLDYAPKLSSNTQKQLLSLLPAVMEKHYDALSSHHFSEFKPNWVKHLSSVGFNYYHFDPAENPIQGLDSLLEFDRRFAHPTSLDHWPFHSNFLKGLVAIYEN